MNSFFIVLGKASHHSSKRSRFLWFSLSPNTRVIQTIKRRVKLSPRQGFDLENSLSFLVHIVLTIKYTHMRLNTITMKILSSVKNLAKNRLHVNVKNFKKSHWIFIVAHNFKLMTTFHTSILMMNWWSYRMK